ncbi:hypothetical protein AURDEDRAFT_170644 [Auricularia subglabra TFB-10046 SS5]|nr:hypothetical protein AURDEDRAFT_170644 [Auricularia subglabra TFB-10046 SS5]
MPTRTIPHDDPRIRYSSLKPDGSKALCGALPSQCANQWWTEANDTGFHTVIESVIVTKGPLGYLWATFTGSEHLVVLGAVNGSAKGVQFYFSDSGGGESGPLPTSPPIWGTYQLFNRTGLEPAKVYSMALVYGGTNVLRILGLRVNSNATLLPPS